MSRRSCVAKTCYNSYLNKPLLKFFPFPNDDKRAQQWLKNCQREDLCGLPLEKLLRKYFLCSAHFEEHWFINPKFKTRFKPNVEPTPTIFLNNLTEFIPKSIQKKISSKINQNQILNETVQRLFTDTEPQITSEETQSEELCRLCARNVSSKDVKHIFLENNKTLRKMIEYLLPEKVSEDDLPHFICSSCEVKVNSCIQTIQFFENTYQRLKGISDNALQDTAAIPEKDLHCERVCNYTGQQSPQTGDTYFENNSEFTVFGEPKTVNLKSFEKPSEMVMVKCSFCPAEFNSEILAKRHKRESHKDLMESSLNGGVLSKCKLCNRVVSSGRLKIHMESHKPKQNQCEYCGTTYKTEKGLETHLTIHESDPFCSFCGKEFNSISQKRLHEKTHADDYGILCDVCGRFYSEQRTLDNHMKTHRAENFVCQVCNKSFATEVDLKKHLETNPLTYSCPICHKEFHLKARVQQHLSTHSDSRLFTCFCGVSFNRMGNLTQHRKQKHAGMNENGELLKCSVCNRMCGSKLKLKWHLSIHAGEKKPYCCEICDKKFGSMIKYKNHERTHTGEHFSCITCFRKFSSKANLKQHELIHKDVYPHHCNLCDRSFKRLQSLIIHKRTHTGERPFVCLACGKAFYQKHDLQKHLKIHLKHGTDDSISSLQIEKLIPIPDLSTMNLLSSENAFQFFTIGDLPQLTLPNGDSNLQMFNLPIFEIQPLVQLSSDI